MPTLSVPQKKSYLPTIQTIPLYVHSFSRDFRLEFRVGVANLQFRGREGRRGRGMVPFKRALVISYRPSMHIISETGKATDFKLGGYIYKANPSKI